MDATQALVAEWIAAGERGTASRLAEHLGVEQATVSRWARGTHRPSAEYWAGIEEYFGKPVGTLGVQGVDLTGRVAHLEDELALVRDALDKIEAHLGLDRLDP